MPAAQNVVGDIEFGIEFNGFFGVVFNILGEFDLGFTSSEQGEAADTDCQLQMRITVFRTFCNRFARIHFAEHIVRLLLLSFQVFTEMDMGSGCFPLSFAVVGIRLGGHLVVNHGSRVVVLFKCLIRFGHILCNALLLSENQTACDQRD